MAISSNYGLIIRLRLFFPTTAVKGLGNLVPLFKSRTIDTDTFLGLTEDGNSWLLYELSDHDSKQASLLRERIMGLKKEMETIEIILENRGTVNSSQISELRQLTWKHS